MANQFVIALALLLSFGLAQAEPAKPKNQLANHPSPYLALVNLAVVTNVVPYIVALSALTVMMKAAKVSEAIFRRNSWVALVAMLYSVYAIYASGKDAVLGGMLVMGIGYVIWGFIAPRFTTGMAGARVQPTKA